ncbi:MAG: ABC transporter permease, partial [Paracoccaceae bacterium]|nr:ABC transporter permease [Paracoccaceae bacterium]
MVLAADPSRTAPDPKGAILPTRGLGDRLSAVFWRHPNVLLVTLLALPLLWLVVVYLGSLTALLLQSFYSIDEFSGQIRREFTLSTYAELLRPANMDIIIRTVAMSAAVTLGAVVIGFPIAYFAARYAKG